MTSDWLDWSECSVTCGVGMRIRKRMFLLDGVDESMCPDTELMQKDNCIGEHRVFIHIKYTLCI